MCIQGSCILDLGCGEGSIGKNLKDMGCKVIGVDASQAMVDATLALGTYTRFLKHFPL